MIDAHTSLDDAVRCALVSMDSTIRSNATVGPPVEVLAYTRDSLSLQQYALLTEDDSYLLELRRSWNERLLQAFQALPSMDWSVRGDAVNNSQAELPAPVMEPVEAPATCVEQEAPLGPPPIPQAQPQTPMAPPMAAPLPGQTQNQAFPPPAGDGCNGGNNGQS